MKLATHHTHNSTIEGVETFSFTMEANAKAFSIMLDGLYSNKIRAVVRELWTNAYDAHVDRSPDMAGVPFDVHLPNLMDPMFRVRDYGVSLTHEQVRSLYTRLFASSKDASNDVVGALGLGSKSPFAYTDQFTVTCWLDGRKRVYLASMAADGVPTITMLSDDADDGEQGVEVAMAVSEADFHRFEAEARHLAIGFDPVPNVDGVELRTATPLAIGDDAAWAVFEASHMDNMVLGVRQGCVIYPVTYHDITRTVEASLEYRKSLIINVPIGAVSITPSRESLSMDDATIEYVKKAVDAAIAAMKQQLAAEAEKCTTLIEAMRFWYGDVVGGVRTAAGVQSAEVSSFLRGISPTWRGQHVSQYLPKLDILDGLMGYQGNNRQKDVDFGKMQIEWQRRNQYHFILVDTDNKPVRFAMRVRDFVANNYGGRFYTYLVNNPTKAQVAAMKKAWALPDSAFIQAEALPDPGPTNRASNGVKTLAGVRLVGRNHYAPVEAVTEIPKDYIWVQMDRVGQERLRANVFSPISNATGFGLVFDSALPVLVFTENAAKRHKPDPKKALNHRIQTYVAANIDTWVERIIAIRINHKIEAFALGNVIAKRPLPQVDSWNNLRYGIEQAIRSEGRWNEIEAEVNKAVEQEQKKYPLLFDPKDKAAIAWYKEQRDKLFKA